MPSKFRNDGRGLLSRELHGQSIKRMSRCCHLTVKNCSCVHDAPCFVGLQHGECLEALSHLPSVGAVLLGSSSLAAELLALESESQKAEIGVVVKGNKKRSMTPGLRGVGVSFSWILGKCLCSGSSWKEMEELLITAK